MHVHVELALLTGQYEGENGQDESIKDSDDRKKEDPSQLTAFGVGVTDGILTERFVGRVLAPTTGVYQNSKQ